MALDLVSIAQPHYIPGFVLITNFLSNYKISTTRYFEFIFINFVIVNLNLKPMEP